MKPVKGDKNRRFKLEHWHIISFGLILYDLLMINSAYFAALWLRFDCRISMIPAEYLDGFARFMPCYTVICLAIFWKLRLYNSIWRFASYNELLRVGIKQFMVSFSNSLALLILMRVISCYSMR